MEEKTNPEEPKNTGKTEGNKTESTKSTAQEFKEGWKETTQSKENKKVLAGLLAIFFGAFGVHKFILGYNQEGIILLVATLAGIVLTCVFVGSFILMATGIVAIVEGIIYLTKSDEEFYNTYQVNKKPWF